MWDFRPSCIMSLHFFFRHPQQRHSYIYSHNSYHAVFILSSCHSRISKLVSNTCRFVISRPKVSNLSSLETWRLKSWSWDLVPKVLVSRSGGWDLGLETSGKFLISDSEFQKQDWWRPVISYKYNASWCEGNRSNLRKCTYVIQSVHYLMNWS